jgi:hypothetical protein
MTGKWYDLDKAEEANTEDKAKLQTDSDDEPELCKE